MKEPDVRAVEQSALEGQRESESQDERREGESQDARREQGARRHARVKDALLFSFIIAGLALAALLTRSVEARRPSQSPLIASEQLYTSPETVRRMSLCFNGLVADWYWMRTLQYVGRKAIAYGDALQLDDLSPLGLTQLAPMLEHTTKLDPHFMAAYEYGAVVLPSVDRAAAIRLIQQGIKDNPTRWRLWHHLGYIHWQAGSFGEAAAAYAEGARIEGAPAWMRIMSAQMEVGGGSRETARHIYRRMLAETDDEHVKQHAFKRLLQIDSLDERDAIRQALQLYQTKTGRCPRQWREVAHMLAGIRFPARQGFKLDSVGAPLDPAGFPYVLASEGCDVQLNGRSEIPQK